MGDLPKAQVAAGVDRLKGAFGVDANAGDTSGGDVLFKGQVLGEDTNDLDLVLASSPSMKSAFSPLGLLPEVPYHVVEVLIDLIAISLWNHRAGLCRCSSRSHRGAHQNLTTGDDVAPVAAVDQVIAITAIDDVPAGKTPEGFTT